MLTGSLRRAFWDVPQRFPIRMPGWEMKCEHNWFTIRKRYLYSYICIIYMCIYGHNSPQSTVTKTQGSAFGSHGLLTVLLGNVRILWGPWFVLSKFQKRRVKAEHCPVPLTTGDRRSGATWSFVLLGQWLTFRLWGFTYLAGKLGLRWFFHFWLSHLFFSPVVGIVLFHSPNHQPIVVFVRVSSDRWHVH